MVEIISFTCKHHQKKRRVYARRNKKDRTELVSIEVKITLCNTLTGYLFDDFRTRSGTEFKVSKSTTNTMAELERSTEGRWMLFSNNLSSYPGNSSYIVHRHCTFWIRWLSDTTEISRSKWFTYEWSKFRINVLYLVHATFLYVVGVIFHGYFLIIRSARQSKVYYFFDFLTLTVK